MRHSDWFTLIPAAIVATVPANAHATVYMSVQQAQQAMFPGATFADRSANLTDPQRKAIAKASGTSAPKNQRVWEARVNESRAGWLMIDRVIGKHEYITYAVALLADGTVASVEILEYRETYGGEVRNANWRRQFVGKKAGQDMKLGRDIKNISGATLSSRNITDGVRRLLVTYDLLLAHA